MVTTLPDPILAEVLAAHPDFGHRDHLELAWRFADADGVERVAERMSRAIRHVAQAHGAPQKYHHTITLAWLKLVTSKMQPPEGSFASFLAANPELLDRALLSHYYSSALLTSDAARLGWQEPDLRPLPEP